jgi:hypothetical protein
VTAAVSLHVSRRSWFSRTSLLQPLNQPLHPKKATACSGFFSSTFKPMPSFAKAQT